MNQRVWVTLSTRRSSWIVVFTTYTTTYKRIKPRKSSPRVTMCQKAQQIAKKSSQPHKSKKSLTQSRTSPKCLARCGNKCITSHCTSCDYWLPTSLPVWSLPMSNRSTKSSRETQKIHPQSTSNPHPKPKFQSPLRSADPRKQKKLKRWKVHIRISAKLQLTNHTSQFRRSKATLLNAGCNAWIEDDVR